MPGLDQLAEGLYTAIVNAVNAILQGIASVLDALLAMLIGGAAGVVESFPMADPLGLPDVSGIVVGYSWLNQFLPVAELIGFLAVIVTVMTAIFVVRVATWAWQQLPFT